MREGMSRDGACDRLDICYRIGPMRRAIIILLLTLPIYAQNKPWASTFGAGLALTSGNTSTRNYNVSLTTKYDPKTRLLFKADALYILGKSDGVKQVDKATADAREEYTLSDRTFTFGELERMFREAGFTRNEVSDLPRTPSRVIVSRV